jgi:hypothetical protein|eukprot:7380686-Prymnesium_polylepis.2
MSLVVARLSELFVQMAALGVKVRMLISHTGQVQLGLRLPVDGGGWRLARDTQGSTGSEMAAEAAAGLALGAPSVESSARAAESCKV